MRVAILFDNFGPYHLARLRAAAQVCELTALQVVGESAEYGWAPTATAEEFRLVTLGRRDENPSWRELGRRLAEALRAERPEALFVPGWSSRAALAALGFGLRNGIPVVAMSESGAADARRAGWREALKRGLRRGFSAGLVSGQPQRNYLRELGFPAESIFQGYGAIDNDYFAAAAHRLRTRADVAANAPPSPPPGRPATGAYFLASARFLPRKNLARLLAAYAQYRAEAEQREIAPWSLIILGDGPLGAELKRQCAKLGLTAQVQMPGFVPMCELPHYYAHAGAFVHASLSEPWGLVVNEAMASGLPVLVSRQTGCAADLVREGANGFLFDAANVGELARRLGEMAELGEPERRRLGAAGANRIEGWHPRHFAAGVRAAADYARQHAARLPRWRPCGLGPRLIEAEPRPEAHPGAATEPKPS